MACPPLIIVQMPSQSPSNGLLKEKQSMAKGVGGVRADLQCIHIHPIIGGNPRCLRERRHQEGRH